MIFEKYLCIKVKGCSPTSASEIVIQSIIATNKASSFLKSRFFKDNKHRVVYVRSSIRPSLKELSFNLT